MRYWEIISTEAEGRRGQIREATNTYEKLLQASEPAGVERAGFLLVSNKTVIKDVLSCSVRVLKVALNVGAE